MLICFNLITAFKASKTWWIFDAKSRTNKHQVDNELDSIF